jgi:hypothetical protein
MTSSLLATVRRGDEVERGGGLGHRFGQNGETGKGATVFRRDLCLGPDETAEELAEDGGMPGAGSPGKGQRVVGDLERQRRRVGQVPLPDPAKVQAWRAMAAVRRRALRGAGSARITALAGPGMRWARI